MQVAKDVRKKIHLVLYAYSNRTYYSRRTLTEVLIIGTRERASVYNIIAVIIRSRLFLLHLPFVAKNLSGLVALRQLIESE